MVSNGSTSGVGEILTQDEYNKALEGDTVLDKKIVKLCELNELVYENLILSITTSSSVGKIVFGLVNNAKSKEFLEGIYKVAWDRLVSIQPHCC